LLPARSNHRLADVARGRYLRELSAAGVRVRLTRPGMLHVKAWLIDGDAVAGSANLDLRSLFLNYELMCRIRGETEIAWLTHWLDALDARADDAPTRPVSALRELLEGLVLLTAFQL
jgi:cardiolipin synthase